MKMRQISSPHKQFAALQFTKLLVVWYAGVERNVVSKIQKISLALNMQQSEFIN